jgi:hypothetical protein
LSFVSFPLSMILSVFCQFPFGHDKDRQYHGQRESDERQTLSWPKENWQKKDNIMAKVKLKKDRNHHGQRETDKRQTITWPKVLFGHVIVCLLSVFLWPCYCLSFVSFPLAMIVSVFFQLPFGHDIVCLFSASFCPWY